MNSAAITYLTLDEGPQRLWHEFLTGYFNGGSHTLDGQPVSFPAAALSFDQAPLNAPLDGVAIAVIAETTGHRVFLNETKQYAFDEVAWTFYIRADPGPNQAGAGNAKHQCRRAAQLLRGLLQSRSLTSPLDEKGLRVKNVPQAAPVPGTDFLTQMIRATGEVHYESP